MNSIYRTASSVSQILFFIAAWLCADQLRLRLHLPLPTGVIGLLLVSVLLWSGKLPLHWMEKGARHLLAEMLLFFIPPVLAVTQCGALLARYGLGLLVLVMLGCTLVMGGTGLMVDRVFRFERARRRDATAPTERVQ